MFFTSRFLPGLMWIGLILASSSVFSQSEPLPAEPKKRATPGSYEKHSLHVAYRVPEFRDMPIVNASMAQLHPQPFPIVLGYSQLLAPRHALTVEFGFSNREAVQERTAQGAIYYPAVRPELRLGYRWMLSKSRSFVPYIGAATTFSADIASKSDDRWLQNGFLLQVLAGIRIYPIEGPIFIQIEVPCSIFHSVFAPPNSNLEPFNTFGPSYFPSQFWPVAGLGIRW